jgi:signal transduction histidine kinase
VARASAPGLRLQIVLALAGLMLLAFVPLFYAVASLTRATVRGAREQQALALSRSIAAHAADVAASGDRAATERAIQRYVGTSGVRAVCAFGRDGGRLERLACAGPAADVEEIQTPQTSSPEQSALVRTPAGRELRTLVPTEGGAVVTRIALDEEGDRGASLVRLVALYMITFALALLVFAYFALTRLIVRPIDQLVHSADRVAGGARTLPVPRAGARELVDLATSVRSMAEKLISEEATLILKVEELTQTQAQLVRSERMASVGRLAAGVAHEIGNPIAALIGMQDLLLAGDAAPETQRDFLMRMRRETERIHSVLRDLLDFARPEERLGTGSGPPSPADVRAAIDDVASLVKTQKDFRDVRIEVDVKGALQVVLPAPRLTQVLLNLVLNAGAAIGRTPEGSGRNATVRSAKRGQGCVTVRAYARPERHRVRIEVEDDGPGVAAAVRDRLFEPFVTTKEVGEGTGLGLAVCRGVVESAGGDIGLDLSYEAGARFYVELPAAS